MDRAGTLPLNLHETETVLKPVKLNSLRGVERVPSERDEPPNSNEDVSLPPKSPDNKEVLGTTLVPVTVTEEKVER